MKTRNGAWHSMGPLAVILACGACDVAASDDELGDPAAAAAGTSVTNATHDPAAGMSWPVSYRGTASALRRLSRDELVVTMRELTGDAPARDDLPTAPRSGNGALLTGGLPYVGTELPKLNLAMSAFAAKVAPPMLAKSSCTATADPQRACLQKWASEFAERALRRPTRADENALYATLVAGADGTPAADADAVRAVLEAIFFSPTFLYRTEIGAADPKAANVRALNASEVATRLSYLATLAPADGPLLDAARDGSLKDGPARVRHLDRLLATDLGRHAIAVLVLEWLGANEPFAHFKSARYQTGLPNDFEGAIRTSAEKMIADALLSPSSPPTVANLLQSKSYLADPAIAAITKAGDDASTGRAGLLMHPQVIAAHTKEDGASPFRLGRFLREDLLCEAVGNPPASASALALPDLPAGATLRENFQHKISAGQVCQSCHAQFAPLGYAFLPFDPLGRWAKQDPSGRPWDLSGTLLAYGGRISFESASDLTRVLGASPQVHGCFAQAALEWSLGRNLVKDDESLVRAIDGVVRRTDGNVIEVLRGIVSAPEFATAIAAR